MSIYQALVLIGDASEDNGGTPFRWGTVISKNPTNSEGETVKNPASILLYGSLALKPGSIKRIAVVMKGIPGLYTVVDAESVSDLLTEMDLKDIKELPEIPVIESEVRPLSSEERAERRKKRGSRRAQNATTSTAVQEENVPQNATTSTAVQEENVPQ